MEFRFFPRAALLTLVALTTSVGAWWLASLPVTQTDISLEEAVQIVDRNDLTHAEILLRGYPADAQPSQPLILLRGYRALAAGRPDDALKYFRYLKPEGEIRAVLLRCTGESLYKTGQLGEAERCFQLILLESPGDAQAHRWMAAIHYDLGRMDASLFHLRELSEHSPDDSRPHFMRGVIYHDFGQLNLALSAFNASLSLAGTPEQTSEIRLRLAQVQIESKDFASALLTLADLPDSLEKTTMVAECFWNQGRIEEASKLMSSGEESSAATPRGRLLQARIALESGDSNRSVSLLKSLIDQDGSSEESEYLLAMAYQQRGDQALYQQHLRRSEEIKVLKTRLTELSSRAMAAQHDASVRLEMASVCEQLGMQRMADVWRQAADACLTASPLREEVPAP
jgi:predicted Zn-dependent protease